MVKCLFFSRADTQCLITTSIILYLIFFLHSAACSLCRSIPIRTTSLHPGHSKTVAKQAKYFLHRDTRLGSPYTAWPICSSTTISKEPDGNQYRTRFEVSSLPRVRPRVRPRHSLSCQADLGFRSPPMKAAVRPTGTGRAEM